MKIAGYIRWYDEKSDEGILQDFKGNEYFFNSWSFPDTHYRVTGKSKKTNRTVTVETRCFPGLFLKCVHIKDWQCAALKTNQPFYFEQAKGINFGWAVRMDFAPELRERVIDHRISNVMKSLKGGLAERHPEIWIPYYKKLLKRLRKEKAEII